MVKRQRIGKRSVLPLLPAPDAYHRSLSSELQTRHRPPQAILVTAGENGAAYSMGGQTGFIPVFEGLNVVETTGAGDAFSAGFISEAIKLLSSKEEEKNAGLSPAVLEGIGGRARDMVRFASAVGALTCCGDGAIKPQPLRGEVLGLLQQSSVGSE